MALSAKLNFCTLRMVKADGEIIDCMNTLKKDNTGYHLKHLFIGSEGTLGIVTEVAIQCPPKPQSVSLALLGVTDFDHALKTFRLASKMLSEILSACELIDENCMNPVVNTLGVRNPLSDHPFYVLIELSGSNAAHDEEKLNAFLESAMGEGIVSDGTVTSEPSRIQIQSAYMGAKFLNILPAELKTAIDIQGQRKKTYSWLAEHPFYTVEEFMKI